MSTHPVVPAAGEVTVYSTSWCPYCSLLTSSLVAEGVQFTIVDLDEDPEAAAYVERVNGGNRVVPTVVFPDATTATNPAIDDVRLRLY
ncbi:glutaredoxin domain-containing protein [Gephyromycinifex aptenodytis]|uniref:glutaredoxin domain-containing protein n=1 Tax=Gephyromycinifex aptenodytis TaxID=2716227 RepID=UPI001448557A|nr:glutaredoxin domain-containing protein [Gephyromycinifex aptenodytis]